MVMLKLKLEMPVMLDETESASTAVTYAPAATTVFSWFQVTVM
jgi:hypothetical protein